MNAVIAIPGDPGYGYPLLIDELAGQAWPPDAARSTVCGQLRPVVVSSWQTSAVPAGPPVHDGLGRREDTATEPNRLAEITDGLDRRGKRSSCPIEDACSDHTFAVPPPAAHLQLAVNPLRHAVALRGPAALIDPSARGHAIPLAAHVHACERTNCAAG